MNQTDITKRTIGVNYTGKGDATIVVWAPKAASVALQIEQQDTLALEPLEYGYWQLHTTKLLPGMLYKFQLDGVDAYPDPASLAQPHGVHGASQALDLLSYPWQDLQWNNPPLKDYLLYELHTGTFTAEGTFASLEEKLDYLVELGVNAIEIMPVAQFAGGRNWGYDGVYPFAVQDSYGGAQGLQHLVDTCHKKGIAVVLDVVYNHLGPEGNYLDVYGHYFTDKYNTPWGNAINFDDAWCDAVRQYFIDNVLMWFRDFHIDALRMDAVHAIKDFSARHILQEIKQQVDALQQYTGRTHHLIVELDLNDTRFINPQSKGGFGMDAQWVDEFHHALRVTASGERTGYYEDFNGLEHLAKAFQDAYVFDGQYSPHRKKHFGIKATDNPGDQFIVFSQNHDQVGNRMLGERTSTLSSFAMQKLMAGTVLCSPYLPMLFMGEEYGEPNPFMYFVSHTDAELAQAVREGRKREFAAFHLEGEAPDPVAEETFNQSKLQWHLTGENHHAILLHYYKDFIALRKIEPALYNLGRKNLAVEAHTAQQVLQVHRWHNDDQVLCCMNFSKKEQQFVLTDLNKGWYVLLSSADKKYGGHEVYISMQQVEQSITLPPESIIVLKNKQ